jgi:hypothetical protein
MGMEYLWSVLRQVGTIALLSGILTFGIQPLMLQLSPYATVDGYQSWLRDRYVLGAGAVFWVCLAATIAWCIMVQMLPSKAVSNPRKLGSFWWRLLLLPLISLTIALVSFSGSPAWKLQLALAWFHSLNLALVYWVGTALCTPRSRLSAVPAGWFIYRLARLLRAVGQYLMFRGYALRSRELHRIRHELEFAEPSTSTR